MVIELDPKKMAKSRKTLTWMSLGNLFMWVILIVPTVLVGLGSVLGDGYGAWFFVTSIVLSIVAFVFTMWRGFRRLSRHRRTNHHLFLDETGIAFIIGHTRVDIPWGDVDKVIYRDSLFAEAKPELIATHKSNIKLKLRKETPYNKRVYRIFDDYELPLYDIYAEIKTLWEQGKGKTI